MRPHSIPRRPFLAGVGTSMLAGYLTPVPVRAEPLVRPPQVLVFDVAESLLDLQTLRPLFERLFGDGAVGDEWFGETILYSESATLTNTYTPFGKLGAGVLRMLGHIHGVGVGKAEVAALGEGLAALAPHPDTPDSLRKLKSAGYRLVTLTDSAAAPGAGALHAAGLDDLFEQQFTAQTVRRYKPARETYQMVAKGTGTSISDLCMIAAHPWDLVGARAAGCSAALIQRVGVAPLILSGLAKPEVIGLNLNEIATRLLELKNG